jgi:hypothetical protein
MYEDAVIDKEAKTLLGGTLAEESAHLAQERQIRATFRNVKASREDARLKGGARRDSRLK